MKVLTTRQPMEEAQRIAARHLATHKYNTDYVAFVECDTCGLPMPRKFSKRGRPFDTTKFYHLVHTGNGDIKYTHNNLRICYEQVQGKKWGAR